jgi:GAF domain-containing protein
VRQITVSKIDENLHHQLESLYEISVEIAALRDLPEIYRRALKYCLAFTSSEMGFIDLVNRDGVDMDVVAIEGFRPPDPNFYERFKTMPVRSSVFGITIIEDRPHVSNDVDHDPLRVGTPPGHPHAKVSRGAVAGGDHGYRDGGRGQQGGGLRRRG